MPIREDRFPLGAARLKELMDNNDIELMEVSESRNYYGGGRIEEHYFEVTVRMLCYPLDSLKPKPKALRKRN